MFRCTSGALYVSVGVLCLWLAPVAASNTRQGLTGGRCEKVEDHQDKCAFVQESCDDVGDAVNYLWWIYCGNAVPKAVGVVLVTIWLVLLLSMLGTTADVFFVEQLEFISERFQLPDDVAGATLMAFGNGAPDVFTAWNAIEEASDFSLVLAELLGAAIFVTTVVLGSVILCSKRDCLVDSKPFARDAATLALSVFCIAACVLDGKIQLVESAALMGLYVVYVVVVVSNRSVEPAYAIADDDDVEMDEPPTTNGGELSLRGVHWSSTSTRFSKAVHVVEWPFAVMRHLSIPAASFESWGKTRRQVAAASVFGAVFVVALDVAGPAGLVQGRPPVIIWLSLTATAACLLVLRCTRNNEPPSKPVKLALVVSGFFAAVAWLDLLASETVAVIESLGAAAGLSSAVLGITALAWGNCVGDIVTDTTIARAGNPKAAIASVFNSPLFSQIMALGAPVSYYCMQHGALHLHLDNNAILSFSAIAISLASTSVVCACAGSRLPRSYAFVLFGIYAVYVILSLTVELDRELHAHRADANAVSRIEHQIVPYVVTPSSFNARR